MKRTPIDNGFELISARDARKLAEGTLPREGRELLVTLEDGNYWLSRTMFDGKLCWSIRPSAWRLRGNVAVL